MRISQLAVATLLALSAPHLLAQNASPIRDTTAYTASATALRAQPDSASRVLVHLPAAWPVHVTACTAGWCAAQAASFSGFLRADSLTLSAPHGAPAPGAAANTPVASIGVDLSTRLTLGLAIGPKVRLAPEVSYVSQQSKSFGNTTQIGPYIEDGSDTELWLGLGLYFVTPLPVRPLGAPCLLYIGPRAGVAFANSESKVENAAIPSDATAKRTDTWVGVAAGSELMVSKRFSVGAEVQATKVFAGSTSVGGVTTSSIGVGQSWVDFETRGTLVLRFYP